MYSNGFSKKWFWKFFMMWFFWKKFSNREFSKIPHQKYFFKSLKVLFLCVFYEKISQTLGTFFRPFDQLKIGVYWGKIKRITIFNWEKMMNMTFDAKNNIFTHLKLLSFTSCFSNLWPLTSIHSVTKCYWRLLKDWIRPYLEMFG